MDSACTKKGEMTSTVKPLYSATLN